MARIILASTSPRRSELLTGCQLKFEVRPPECDETVLPGESPEALVHRLSRMKADVVANQNPDAWVIGGDTIVVLDGEILGKPKDSSDAIQMLQKMAGRQHVVFGGLTVTCKALGITETEVHQTSVLMVEMSPEVIRAYVATGEPMDKAGSYALQGIGGQFVQKVQGSYSNVIGLNITAVMATLRRYGAVAW